MEGDSRVSDEKFMPKSHKKALIALLGVVIVVAAGMFLMNGSSPDETPTNTDQTPTNNNQTPEENSNEPAEETTDEETVNLGLNPSQIEGEIVDVTITDGNVVPGNPQITRMDGVRFINEAEVKVELVFERDFEDFQIPAGESVIIDMIRSNYYDVNPAVQDSGFNPANGKITVLPS